jgi:hypothetical protein
MNQEQLAKTAPYTIPAFAPDWSFTGGWRRETCRRLFKQRLAEKHPELDIVGEYLNRNTPVRVRCSICGTIFTVLPKVLLGRKKFPGIGCVYCPGYAEARANARWPKALQSTPRAKKNTFVDAMDSAESVQHAKVAPKATPLKRRIIGARFKKQQ